MLLLTIATFRLTPYIQKERKSRQNSFLNCLNVLSLQLQAKFKSIQKQRLCSTRHKCSQIFYCLQSGISCSNYIPAILPQGLLFDNSNIGINHLCDVTNLINDQTNEKIKPSKLLNSQKLIVHPNTMGKTTRFDNLPLVYTGTHNAISIDSVVYGVCKQRAFQKQQISKIYMK